MSSGPLAGVTVIECASYISGPYAGLLLAQLGADVVKVKAPGSDDPFRLEAGLLRQASGPAGERFLVPRGAIAYAGDLDACPMEVPALGG